MPTAQNNFPAIRFQFSEKRLSVFSLCVQGLQEFALWNMLWLVWRCPTTFDSKARNETRNWRLHPSSTKDLTCSCCVKFTRDEAKIVLMWVSISVVNSSVCLDHPGWHNPEFVAMCLKKPQDSLWSQNWDCALSKPSATTRGTSSRQRHKTKSSKLLQDTC